MGVKTTIKVLLSRKSVVVSTAFLLLLIAVALFAKLLAPYGYNDQDFQVRLSQPTAQHLLGTDYYGRDVLSRLIYGSQISLVVAFVSVVLAGVPVP